VMTDCRAEDGSLSRADSKTTTVADIETTAQKMMSRDVVAWSAMRSKWRRGKNKLEDPAHQRGLLRHVLEEPRENAIAILINDIVTSRTWAAISTLRKMSAPRLLLTMRARRGHGGQSSGTCAPCISRREMTRSARFTA